jgi:thiosulfate dehydrogenase [quinone] large subunit
MSSFGATLKNRFIEDPPFAKFLFSDARASLIWLPFRLWLGLSWLDAGLHKIQDPKWVAGGEALKGYWTRAIAIPEAPARPAIASDFWWYRNFLQGLLDGQSYTWFAPLVAWGEFLVGIALLIGAFVGIAAFFGMFMNLNFIMAGSASTNGLMLIVGVALVMAWKVAGYIGADYFLLRWLGVPWKTRTHALEDVPPASTSAPRAGPAK